MNEKTNVMRILDKNKIEYKSIYYGNTSAISGVDVANVLNEDPSIVFKTLVTVGSKKKYYVFDIPSNKELDLKKCANAVGEKNVEMIKSKDLLNITGYIHGGCSPIGMKKQFKTIFDYSVLNYNNIYLSAGKIGYQINISVNDLKKIIDIETYDITK